MSEINSLMSWDGTGKIYSEETVQMLQAEIERLREAQRWIPVSERLPEEPIDNDVSTFICLIRGISFYGDVYHSTRVLRYYNEKFYSIGHISTDWTDQVVAWMPLPEPPQEAEGN